MVIVLYLFYESISKKSYNQLIYFIAISDFFSAVGGLFGISKNGTWNCFIQSFLTNYFPLTSIFWTVVISYLLYDVLQKPHLKRKKHGIDVENWVHLLCWGWPLLLSVLPLTTTDYGTFDGEDGWCFLRPRDGSPKWTFRFWLFAAFFAWVYIAIAIFSLFIFYVGYVVTSPSGYLQTDSIIARTIRKAINKLIWYPLIILTSWVVMTIYELWAGFYPDEVALTDPTFMYFTFTLPLFSGLMTTAAFFGGCPEARQVVSEKWIFPLLSQVSQVSVIRQTLFPLSTVSNLASSTESKASSSSSSPHTLSPLVDVPSDCSNESYDSKNYQSAPDIPLTDRTSGV
jgi:hypothetical protein